MVLMTLGTLACDSVSANTIYRTDTTTTLIELFTTSESDDVAGLTLWILCRMSRTSEIAQGLIKTGLVKELVNRGLRGGLRAAALSAWCIGSLVHTDSIADNLADQHYIISDIVDHLRHTTNLGVSATPLDISSGLFAIARMARSIRLAKALAKAGCVDLLAYHLNNSTDPDVLKWSARAIGCLMRPNSSDMSKILLEKGVAGGLARMPRVLPQDEVEPLASFAFAIQRFSCAEWGGGTRKALVDAGVVDSLLAALRTAADEPYPQVHIELALAVSFLGDVGGSAIRKEIVNAGGVRILKEIAKEAVTGKIGAGRGDEVAKACNMAATSIAGNIWTRNAASAKTAMNHNWSGGCPEYHPPCPLKFQLQLDPMET
ncbi:ARM repeat-containing protein [Marasmius fiardii PR-910]|nr:ARM repeat-containing protein [Marasmius fiardii PR-910]